MRVIILGLLAMFHLQLATAQEGVISLESPHDVPTTMDLLTAEVAERGMTVFGRIDHAANAEKVGLELRPTEVIIFGNPMVGTPLMNCAQSIAIDLPQKMLVWQDEAGQTRLGWNDPLFLRQRHSMDGCEQVLQRVSGALSGIAQAVTSE